MAGAASDVVCIALTGQPPPPLMVPGSVVN